MTVDQIRSAALRFQHQQYFIGNHCFKFYFFCLLALFLHLRFFILQAPIKLMVSLVLNIERVRSCVCINQSLASNGSHTPYSWKWNGALQPNEFRTLKNLNLDLTLFLFSWNEPHTPKMVNTTWWQWHGHGVAWRGETQPQNIWKKIPKPYIFSIAM